MKHLNLTYVFFTFFLFGCSQNNSQTETQKDSTTVTQTDSTVAVKSSDNTLDKAEIQTLIRKALNWAETQKNIDLLPALTDTKDSSCTGFDMAKLKTNLEMLKATGFFSTTFIENYNHIILTLDQKIKNKEFDKWNTYELPTFRFANDVDPWCECQDNMSYDKVEVTVIKLDNKNGELNWKWGGLSTNTDKSWKDFSYKFKVEKEDGKWKIAYLQGFDFTESTMKDGV